VVALGKSRAEVGWRIKEASAAYSDDLREQGVQFPASHHAVGTIPA
jgi:predicted RNase H-like HicB family nuclease